LACLYSESARGLVSLLPRDQAALSLATLGNAPSPATVDAFLTGLGANPNAGGVYVVMAGDRTPLGFHCGYDKNFPPIAGLPAPIDASLDAVDGALTGAALAREHANGALAWDVDLAGDGQITLYFAVGATYAEASALLGPARSAGVVTPMTGIADLSDARTGPFLQRALLPVETLVPVASRALLTIYVARDARSGAIASSLAAQPARAVDRPALGAYINLALDLAGQHDMVEAHNLFYTRSQRQGQNGSADPKQGKHEGSWASASFLDSPPGAPGAPAVAPALVAPDSDFAIDATGLALWTLGEHAKWIGDNEQNILNAKQRAYLESVFPAIERAANLLTNCVDAKTALPCPALEADGTAKQPPSLRGAAAAVLGLYSATQSAAVIGKTGDARRWQSRMFALKAQIDKLPPNGFLTADRGYQGDFTARALAIWPAQLHGINDTRTASTALALRTDVTPLFDAHMSGENPARVLLALGIHEFGSARPDAAVKMQLLRWLTAQTTEMRTPVFGFGEVVAAVDPTGYDARVGVPSASEAALVYLATMAVRERPRGETSPLVRLDVRLSANVEGGFQCQFRIALSGGGAAAALALLFLLAVLVRRRKR